MGGASFSRVKFNAREIALSSDEIRAEALASRELQNVLAAGSADSAGIPFSCLLNPPTLASAAGFTMALGAGSAMFYFPTDVSLTVDDSPFEVVRWAAVPGLAFATPDGANPRIDLIVATPAMADADLVSRNILIDPVLRTIAAQNVNKTTNPLSTISVVTGTPAAGPVAPAVPAGKVALYEVYVPAAAPNSTTFSSAQRLWRRAPFPWSTASGIMTGCHLRWDLTVDVNAGGTSTVTLVGLNHRVIIDGELVDFATLNQTAVAQDAGAANPFSVVAGGSDKPYYLYLVGGRHAPQGTWNGSTLVPLTIVESLTPPDLDNYGRPTSPLTTPLRGAAPVEACVYIGLGFVLATTTRRRACIMGPEFVKIVGAESAGALSLTKTGAGSEVFGTIGAKPTLSTRVQGVLKMTAASASAVATMIPDRGDGAGAAPEPTVAYLFEGPQVKSTGAPSSVSGSVEFTFNPANAKIWTGGTGSNLATSDLIQFYPNSYDHRAARIASRG